MPILAEVSDKEPTIASIWCVAALLCLTSFLLCKWRRAATLFVLPLAGFWAWAIISELHDVYVGPAISLELGRTYTTQAHIAAAIPFLIIVLGLWRKPNEHA